MGATHACTPSKVARTESPHPKRKPSSHTANRTESNPPNPQTDRPSLPSNRLGAARRSKPIPLKQPIHQAKIVSTPSEIRGALVSDFPWAYVQPHPEPGEPACAGGGAFGTTHGTLRRARPQPWSTQSPARRPRSNPANDLARTARDQSHAPRRTYPNDTPATAFRMAKSDAQR